MTIINGVPGGLTIPIPVAQGGTGMSTAAPYGGMFAYGKAIAFNIVTANVYHAFGLRTAGDITASHLNLFTQASGRIVDPNITSEANNGGKLQVVCNVNHLLTTNDIVTLHGMLNAGHNGVCKVTVDNATTFTAQNINYVAGAGASNGSVYEPAYLQASVSGVYSCLVLIDGTAAQSNKNWKWELNVDIVPADNVVTERNSTATLASMATGGIIDVVADNRIWLSGKNTSDTSDYTVKNFNIYLNKIG